MKTTLKKLVGRFIVAFSCWGAISLCQQYAYAGETTQEKVLRDATVRIYRASDLIKYFDENGKPKEEFKLPPCYTGTIIGKQDGGVGVVVTSLSENLVKGIDLTKSKAWWIVLQPVYDDQGETVEKVYAMGATPICEEKSVGLLAMSIPSDKCTDKQGNPRPHLPKEFPNFQIDSLKTGDDCFCLTYSARGRADESDPGTMSQVQSFLGGLRKSIVKDDGSVKLNQVLLHYNDGSQGFLGRLLAYMNANRSLLTVERVSNPVLGRVDGISFSSANVDKSSLGAAVYSKGTNNVVGFLLFATSADPLACNAKAIRDVLERIHVKLNGEGNKVVPEKRDVKDDKVTISKPDSKEKTKENPGEKSTLDTDIIIYGAIGLLGVALIIVLALLFRSKPAVGERTSHVYTSDAPTVVAPQKKGGADKSTPVMRLVGEDGTSYGVTYDELKRGVSLGRGSVADKVFSNETVSRKHVIIFRKHGRAFVEDCGSSGGTILNGVKLEPNKPALITRKTSDLKLANYTVRVVIVMDQN